MLQRSVLTLGGNATRRRAANSIYKYLKLNMQVRKESVAEERFLQTVAKAHKQRERQIRLAIEKAQKASRTGKTSPDVLSNTGAYQRNLKRAEQELRRLAVSKRQREAEAATVVSANAGKTKQAEQRARSATRVEERASTLSRADETFFRRLEASRAKRAALIERMLAKQATRPVVAEEIEEDAEIEASSAPVVEESTVTRPTRAARRRVKEEAQIEAVSDTQVDTAADDAAQVFLQRLEEETQRRRAMIESALAEQHQRVAVEAEAEPEPQPAIPLAPKPPRKSNPKPQAPPRTVPPTTLAAPARVVSLPPRLVPLRPTPSVQARTPAPVQIPPQQQQQQRVTVQVPIATSTGLFRI